MMEFQLVESFSLYTRYSGTPLYQILWELKTVCYREVSTIQRLFYFDNSLPGPIKSVCYRFLLLGEFVIRGSTVYPYFVQDIKFD